MSHFSYHIDSSRFYSAALLLLTTGVAMMLAFWFRWYYAAPALLLLTVAVCHGCRQISRMLKDDKPVEIDIRVLIVLTILPLWMLGAGMGGFWGQYWYDDGHRNAVMYELVNNPWPVTHTYDGEDVYLCYYFSFWLPPAAIGKLFGTIRAAWYALIIQEYIYLVIITLMVMHYCGKRYLLVALILYIFMPPARINGWIFREWLEWYCKDYTVDITDPTIFESPSVLYNCSLTYNQSLPAMLSLPLMMKIKKNAGLTAFTAALLFIYGPMCAIPLLPIIIYLTLKDTRCFKTPELWAGVAICALIAVFFAGSGHGGTWKGIWRTDLFQLWQICAMFAGYLIVSVGIMLAFIWKRVRHDTLFFILLGSTVVWAWIMPDYYNFDFSWKGPTLLMFFFNMEICRLCANVNPRRHWLKCSLLAVVLLLGLKSNVLYPNMSRRLESRLIPGHRHEREYRPHWLDGKLLDKNQSSQCYGNFAAEAPTLYSRYFMPEAGDNTPTR